MVKSLVGAGVSGSECVGYLWFLLHDFPLCCLRLLLRGLQLLDK